MDTMRRLAKLAGLLGLVAVAATGCRGCLTENVVYEHTFNRPDPRYCGPCLNGKPCPPLIPEFEAPPGGPYLPVQAPAPPPRPLTVAPTVGKGTVEQRVIQEETISRPAPAPMVPEVLDK